MKSPPSIEKRRHSSTEFSREIRSSPRSRRRFSSDEVRRLVRGVLVHGVGHWAHIRDFYDFGDRTSVDLKDKWRNLEKSTKASVHLMIREEKELLAKKMKSRKV